MRWFFLFSLAACKGSVGIDGDDDRYDAGEDCDDADASSHPGGVEVCDGADNDCNGTVDDGVGTPYYADADGDGYGDAGVVTPSCGEPVAGAVANADDCDDTNPAINPLGSESCDDIDNDCDGRADWGLRVPTDFASIGAAIGASADGDVVCVKPGTYRENIDFAGRAIAVVGLGGSAATILDGDGVGPVVSFDTHEGADTTLTGFTITNGDEADGAGVYLRGASPILTDLVITANQCTTDGAGCRGTGLYAENSAFTLTDSMISENVQRSAYAYYPTNQGAGMYLDSRCNPEIRDVQIVRNRQELGSVYYGLNYGAGLYASSATVSLEGVLIAGNRATGNPTGSYTFSYGGGAYLSATLGTFERIRVSGNAAEGAGGYGGGIYFYYPGDLEIRSSAILGNHAGTVDSTTGEGGGVYASYAAPDLENVDIVGNNAAGALARGGGMFVTYYGSASVRNTAFISNKVDGADASGGAIAVDPAYPYDLVLAYDNFYDNDDEPFSNLDSPVGQDGNIEADPMYTATTGDAAAWDLTLLPSSPMIDAGDPDVLDRDGTRSDIGSRGGPAGR